MSDRNTTVTFRHLANNRSLISETWQELYLLHFAAQTDSVLFPARARISPGCQLGVAAHEKCAVASLSWSACARVPPLGSSVDDAGGPICHGYGSQESSCFSFKGNSPNVCFRL